jgi:hypothetical protein
MAGANHTALIRRGSSDVERAASGPIGSRHEPSPPPCTDCKLAERCILEDADLAALELHARTGRASQFAPRQPNREIFARLIR